MAFEGLAGKLQGVFRRLSGKGKVSEKDVKEAMREVKLALLEADVNFLVVKDFIKKISERAVGEEVLESLTPGQQVIKIVNEEMTHLMGDTPSKLAVSPKAPTTYMMAGLQGAGKTTMCGKLAGYVARNNGKKPLLVACDIYRPAAIKQLQIVGERVGVPVYENGQQAPEKTVQEALALAERNGYDPVIVDTAGRLHIDEEMMDELVRVKDVLHPTEILLVVDAMTGQDAVNVAKSFDQKLDVTGVILTKLDGDTRGGAAISVRAVTGKPIKFNGIGEKMEDIEPFYPDRLAGRILGMGDMLTLIEKAEQSFDEKQSREALQKMQENRFTLDDYLTQLRQMKKMGSVQDILSMVPGFNASALEGVNIDEKVMTRVEAIILSMTPAERGNPDLLNASRRKRIAAGSGTSVQEINKLMTQFGAMRKMMKQMTSRGGSRKGRKGKKGRGGMFGGIRFPF